MATAKRELFKSLDVCEMAQLQPYVLRSWEAEFPGLGQPASAGAGRVYRRADIELVLRIKQLVFGEGLTVAGARRKLETLAPAMSAVSESEAAEVLDALGADVRARIALVRDGLRELHSLLSGTPGSSNGHGARTPPPKRRVAAARSKVAVKRGAARKTSAAPTRKKKAQRKKVSGYR